MDELTELLTQLAADAEKAIEHEKIAEDYRARVRANLPKAYAAGAGTTILERTIHSLYVAKTIGRWVTGDLPPEKPPSRRKRPGAAPGDS